MTGQHRQATQTGGKAPSYDELVDAVSRITQTLAAVLNTYRTFRNVPDEQKAWTSIDQDAFDEGVVRVNEGRALVALANGGGEDHCGKVA